MVEVVSYAHFLARLEIALFAPRSFCAACRERLCQYASENSETGNIIAPSLNRLMGRIKTTPYQIENPGSECAQSVQVNANFSHYWLPVELAR